MTEPTTHYGDSGTGAGNTTSDQDLKSKTENLAKETGEAAKSKAAELRRQADEESRAQTETAGERLERVSRSLDRSADDLREDEEWAANALHGAASQLSTFAQSVKGKSASSLASDARRLAQNEPALFYGACAAAGLVLGRFMTASAPKRTAPTPATQPETSPFADGGSYGTS